MVEGLDLQKLGHFSLTLKRWMVLLRSSTPPGG